MRTPVWLGYANLGDNQEQIIFEQQQFLDRFIRAARTDKVRPASIRLETDSDNVARSWPVPTPGQPPLLTLAMQPSPSFRDRSEEHTSELQSLMRISYAVFCLNN